MVASEKSDLGEESRGFWEVTADFHLSPSVIFDFLFDF